MLKAGNWAALLLFIVVACAIQRPSDAQDMPHTLIDTPFDRILCRDFLDDPEWLTGSQGQAFGLWALGRVIAKTHRTEIANPKDVGEDGNIVGLFCLANPDSNLIDGFEAMVEAVDRSRTGRSVASLDCKTLWGGLNTADKDAMPIFMGTGLVIALMLDGYRSVEHRKPMTFRTLSGRTGQEMLQMFRLPCFSGENRPLLTLYDEWTASNR